MAPTSSRHERCKETDLVQSVARALEMLEMLQCHETVTIAEVAEHHGIHRATALRLLQTLECFGLVTRGQHRGEFRLGLKAFELGALYGQRSTLLRAARPVMRQLARATEATIDLALYDDGEMVLIESIAVRPVGRVGSPVGRRVIASATTTGKLHLSTLPEQEVEQVLARRGLPLMGPNSITDRDRFFEELARVRMTGYAVNDEETDTNVRFVGVPINLPEVQTSPSLILGAQSHRLPLTSIPNVVKVLREAASAIAKVA
jgi:DNA-binding IclR family transcriptional regulator